MHPIEGKCCWRPENSMWTLVYQYPVNAQNYSHTTAPIAVEEKEKEDCPWRINTDGTLIHMFLECSHATALWRQLTRTPRHLIGTHNIVIYGYSLSTSTAHQLINYLIILTKSTIYKTHMAPANED
jgi:hypothetical protein